MSDSDISLAKKRLARDLKILVVVQVGALCVAGLGLSLFGSDVVLNRPDWDAIHSLCGVLGVSGLITFVVATFLGAFRLANAAISLPIQVRIYALGILGFPVLFFLVPPWFILLLPCFLLYSIIGQFLIARWLEKETKDGTMEPTFPE